MNSWSLLIRDELVELPLYTYKQLLDSGCLIKMVVSLPYQPLN